MVFAASIRLRMHRAFAGERELMADAKHLLTEVTDNILIVTLNRPEKLNALSDETMELFDEAVLRLRDTDEIKVMLIRATGRYFCAGVDLKERGKQGGPRDQKRTAT